MRERQAQKADGSDKQKATSKRKATVTKKQAQNRLSERRCAGPHSETAACSPKSKRVSPKQTMPLTSEQRRPDAKAGQPARRRTYDSKASVAHGAGQPLRRRTIDSSPSAAGAAAAATSNGAPIQRLGGPWRSARTVVAGIQAALEIKMRTERNRLRHLSRRMSSGISSSSLGDPWSPDVQRKSSLGMLFNTDHGSSPEIQRKSSLGMLFNKDHGSSPQRKRESQRMRRV